jgi:hypothetical protein
MKAKDHTAFMLKWWKNANIHQVDLAVRQSSGHMMWHNNHSIDNLPLSWAKAENVKQSDIYIRPARGCSWPLVFLDDVNPTMAVRIAKKYHTLVIHTSNSGGCHLWISLSNSLDEFSRYQVQKHLAHLVTADLGSISGEHLGRLAGMKNWKRQGVWVNTIQVERSNQRPLDPTPLFNISQSSPKTTRSVSKSNRSLNDSSESVKEWGWVCGALQSGMDPQAVYNRLLEHSLPRRGHDAKRYVGYTIKRALHHIR